MKSQAFANFPMPILSVIAFLIFFTFFIGLWFWVFRKPSQQIYSEAAQLPLNEADHE